MPGRKSLSSSGPQGSSSSTTAAAAQSGSNPMSTVKKKTTKVNHVRTASMKKAPAGGAAGAAGGGGGGQGQGNLHDDDVDMGVDGENEDDINMNLNDIEEEEGNNEVEKGDDENKGENLNTNNDNSNEAAAASSSNNANGNRIQNRPLELIDITTIKKITQATKNNFPGCKMYVRGKIEGEDANKTEHGDNFILKKMFSERPYDASRRKGLVSLEAKKIVGGNVVNDAEKKDTKDGKDIVKNHLASDIDSNKHWLYNKTVIDMGANIGAWTTQAAYHGARVYAIEPDDETYDVLTKNAEINSTPGNYKFWGAQDHWTEKSNSIVLHEPVNTGNQNKKSKSSDESNDALGSSSAAISVEQARMEKLLDKTAKSDVKKTGVSITKNNGEIICIKGAVAFKGYSEEDEAAAAAAASSNNDNSTSDNKLKSFYLYTKVQKHIQNRENELAYRPNRPNRNSLIQDAEVNNSKRDEFKQKVDNVWNMDEFLYKVNGYYMNNNDETKRVHCIKMDIEGMEIDVIRNMTQKRLVESVLHKKVSDLNKPNTPLTDSDKKLLDEFELLVYYHLDKTATLLDFHKFLSSLEFDLFSHINVEWTPMCPDPSQPLSKKEGSPDYNVMWNWRKICSDPKHEKYDPDIRPRKDNIGFAASKRDILIYCRGIRTDGDELIEVDEKRYG